MKFLSYKEWLIRNVITEKNIEEEECLNCQGEGTLTCDFCGSIIECEGCEGNSCITWDLNEEEYTCNLRCDYKKLLQLYPEQEKEINVAYNETVMKNRKETPYEKNDKYMYSLL